MHSWIEGNKYITSFNEDDVQLAIEQTKARDQGFNNCNKEKRHAYIGKLGEWAFKSFLDSKDLKYIYYEHLKVDDRDFTIPYVGSNKMMEIDVKTDSSGKFITADSYCYVYEKQMVKVLDKNSPINHFVFAKYDLDANICYILGYISLTNFVIKCIKRKAGEIYGYTLTTDDYAVKYKDITALVNR